MRNLFSSDNLSRIILGLVIIKFNVATSVPTLTDGGNTKSLLYLGSIEGKSFFVDNSERLDWNGAKKLCTDAGMVLASIKSVAQTDLLFSALNDPTATKYYHIAGRDSLTASQFAWDTDNETFQNPGTEFVIESPIQTCLFYSPNFSLRGRIAASLCIITWHALCEVTHGQ